MSRTEFIIATAAVLFVAFALGWFASWLTSRFSRPTTADIGELEQMAQSLHEAEETRDQAVAWAREREAELVHELEHRETELTAAMEALAEARHESEELRAYVERVHAAS